MQIRDASDGDEQILRRFLYDAAFWEPEADRPSRDDPLPAEIARYIDGWGRDGDAGVIAIDGDPIGAAWYRLYPADEPGYGFVSDDVPEISIAVDGSDRGRGVGSELLRALIARATGDGYDVLSLSVAMRNPAKRLYERLGFRGMRGAAGSITMVRRAAPS